MNENLTEIAFILDRSGSMESQRTEAITGFNDFLKEQKGVPGDANCRLFLFDHEYLPVAQGVDIGQIEPLNENSYVPRGSTALLDAMGRTIVELGARLAALPEEQRPGKVIVVTITDGLENSSTDYTFSRISEMVRHQEEKYSWDFLYLAASLDGVKEGRQAGVADSHCYAKISESMSVSSRTIAERRRRLKRSSDAAKVLD